VAHENTFSLKSIRDGSLATARKMGFPTNASLPLLDDIGSSKTADEVIDRLLCLFVAAGCSYGFDREKARAWLGREKLLGKMTPLERECLENEQGSYPMFEREIEAMWALAWILGLIPRLDFRKNCSNHFAPMLPNVRLGESSETFRAKIRLRPTPEIVPVCDLAYCLHWGIRHAAISMQPRPGKVSSFVIEERRRALDWFLGNESWHERPLDT
jgi:hypothetical protein